MTIDWGDGSDSTTLTLDAGQRQFSATHQYLDDNPTGTPSDTYTVSVTITDDDTGSDDGSTDVVVNNVPPVIETLSSSAAGVGDAAEGDTVAVSGTFSDVGTLDTHTAVIDWGDGTSSPAAIDESGGSGTFSGEHAYGAGGIYTITVTLEDDDTGQDTGQTAAVITGAGVHDGVLYVIGTDGDDKVHVNQQGNGAIKVHVDFLTDRGRQRTFDLDGIRRIEVLLGDGNDQAQVAGNVALPLVVDGGAGNDKLKAGAGPAVLMGAEGDDRLIGGSGRDILIGGQGRDRVVGGPGDDILIAGATAFDANDDALTQDFAAALLAILDEWNSARGLEQRMANIGGTGSGDRLNGEFFLQADVTVSAGDAGDKLTGSSGENWFFDGPSGGLSEKAMKALARRGGQTTFATASLEDLPPRATGPAPASANNHASQQGADNQATRGKSADVRPDLGGAPADVLAAAAALPDLPPQATGPAPASANNHASQQGADNQATRGNSTDVRP